MANIKILDLLNDIDKNINKIDYTKGLDNGIIQYNNVMDDIKKCSNKIDKIEKDFDNINLNEIDTNYNINSSNLCDHIDKLNKLVNELDYVHQIEDKIIIIKEINNIKNLCKKYVDNMGLNIINHDK